MTAVEGDWPCRFCGSGDIRAIHVHQQARLPLLSCRRCGGYYIPAPAEQELRKHYRGEYADAHRRQYLQEHEAQYETRLYDSILDTLQQSAGLKSSRIKMMDFGCSYAFLLKKASERGMQAVGVEYDPEICKYNREHLGIETLEPARLDRVEDGVDSCPFDCRA